MPSTYPLIVVIGVLRSWGNIADQLLVLTVKSDLLFRVRLQPQPHLLKILAELTDLVIGLALDLEVQVALLDIPRRFLQLCQRHRDRTVDPVDQQPCRYDNDQQIELLDLARFLKCKTYALPQL